MKDIQWREFVQSVEQQIRERGFDPHADEISIDYIDFSSSNTVRATVELLHGEKRLVVVEA